MLTFPSPGPVGSFYLASSNIIPAVVMVVTAEIWVVRSESSLFPFWTWGSSSNSRRIQKILGDLRQTEVLQTGNRRAPVWLWFIRQIVYLFFFQVACNSVKMLSIGWFQCALLSIFASVFMRIFVSIYILHIILLSVLVSGLYWSHKMSWQFLLTPVVWKRFIRYLLFLLFVFDRIYHRSHVWLAFSLWGNFWIANSTS